MPLLEGVKLTKQPKNSTHGSIAFFMLVFYVAIIVTMGGHQWVTSGTPFGANDSVVEPGHSTKLDPRDAAAAAHDQPPHQASMQHHCWAEMASVNIDRSLSSGQWLKLCPVVSLACFHPLVLSLWTLWTLSDH